MQDEPRSEPTSGFFSPQVAVFLGVVLVYLVFQTALGRLPLSSDEVAYKSAGREWAATGRFGAPELVNMFNRPTDIENVFFLCTPLYSFLFGLAVKIIGFGWRSCVFYDAVIAVVLAALTLRVVDLATDRKHGWIAVFGGLAMLPLITHGRPDALGTCFGMVSVLMLWSEAATPKLVASGIALGLCAGTSPPAALILGVVGLNRIAWWQSPWAVKIPQAVVWGVIAFATLGLVVAPILLPHPSSVEQFSLNFQAHVAWAARIFPLLRIIRDLLGIGDDSSDRLLKLFVKATVLVGLLTLPSFVGTGRGRSWLKLWLGPLAGFWLLLTLLQHNVLYYRILTPMCIAGIAVSVLQLATMRPKTTAALCLMLASCWAASGYIFWRDILVMLTLPEGQQPGYQARHLPQLVPKGARVFGHGCWWFLAGHCRVIDAWWAHPEMSTIDYVVLESGEVFRRDVPQRTAFSNLRSLEERCDLTGSPPSDPTSRKGESTPGDSSADPFTQGSTTGFPILEKHGSTGEGGWCTDYVVNPNIKEPELSYICRHFRIVEDGTNRHTYMAFGRPLFRRQKGSGCLVLKRRK
jgi:hypothetical protein